MDSDYISY